MFSMLITWLNARVAVESEEGQTLVEYALIVTLISVAAIIAMTALGTSIGTVFDGIVGEL